MNRFKFEVMHDPRGFFISIGKRELIANTEEVIEAFRHFAGEEHTPFHQGCPLCSAIKEEQARTKYAQVVKQGKLRGLSQT